MHYQLTIVLLLAVTFGYILWVQRQMNKKRIRISINPDERAAQKNGFIWGYEYRSAAYVRKAFIANHPELLDNMNEETRLAIVAQSMQLGYEPVHIEVHTDQKQQVFVAVTGEKIRENPIF